MARVDIFSTTPHVKSESHSCINDQCWHLPPNKIEFEYPQFDLVSYGELCSGWFQVIPPGFTSELSFIVSV